MCHSNPLRIVIFLSLWLTPVFADGPDGAMVAGSWIFELNAGGSTTRPTVTLEVGSKGTLNGVYKSERTGRSEARESDVTDARWDGRRLRFKVSPGGEGRSYDLTFEGTVEGDTFDGEVSYESDTRSSTLAVTGRRKPAAGGAGAVETATKPVEAPKVLSFKEGVDGYQGTADVEIWGVAPTKPLGDQGTMTSDADNGGGESHILLKFEKIFDGDPGATPGRAIPKGARVVKAKLVVIAFDPGNTVYLHPMLVPWDESATWNSMARGVTADDVEATRRWDGFTFGQINMDKQSVEFDVTPTVQAWADGQANHGWVFLNSGGNGWDFYSSEWQETDLRPALHIEWAPRAAVKH